MPRSLPVVPPPGPPATEPLFQKIGIVGLGLVGGSLALACRRAWPSGLVIGVDGHDVLEEAIARHAVDVAAPDLGIIGDADLVVLAAPIHDNLVRLGELDDAVPGAAVVTDVGSTKRTTLDAARALPTRFRFVGGHPLAGAARSGMAYASADLFRDRPWILVPRDDGDAGAVERLTAFVAALGARPSVMDASTHDRLVAALSQAPQLAASALMKVVGERAGDEGLALAGQGLLDTTRLASSPASVWRDICASNADELRPVLDAVIRELQQLRDGLDGGAAVDAVLDAANDWRERLVQARGGTREPG